MAIKSSTCLAILRDKDGYLHFAGDRRVSWHMGRAISRPYPKVAYRNGVLLSGTGLAYLCDVIVHNWQIPSRNDWERPFDYLHNTFLPHLIHYLREERFMDETGRGLSDKFHDDSSTVILVGVEDEVYELSLGKELISLDGIDAPYAHGCGGSLALGSLLTTEGSKMSIKERLVTALEVAAHVSPGCDAVVDIITNKPERKK